MLDLVPVENNPLDIQNNSIESSALYSPLVSKSPRRQESLRSALAVIDTSNIITDGNNLSDTSDTFMESSVCYSPLTSPSSTQGVIESHYQIDKGYDCTTSNSELEEDVVKTYFRELLLADDVPLEDRQLLSPLLVDSSLASDILEEYFFNPNRNLQTNVKKHNLNLVMNQDVLKENTSTKELKSYTEKIDGFG